MPRYSDRDGVLGTSVIELSVDGHPSEYALPPDPDDVEPGDDVGGAGRYRGRRRLGGRPRHAGRGRTGHPTAKWGAAAVVVAVGLVLVGSGALVSYLSNPVTLPVLPSPSPSLSPEPTPVGGPSGDRSRLGHADLPTTLPSGSPGPPRSPGPEPGPTSDPEPAPAPTPGQQSEQRPGQPAPAASDPPTTGAETDDPPPSPECHVEVRLPHQWPGGFQAEYTITNQGEPWDGWEMTFRVSAGVELGSEDWGGDWDQQGNRLTVESWRWNDDVGTGQSVVVGHNTNRDGWEPPSFSDFAVNGAPCTT